MLSPSIVNMNVKIEELLLKPSSRLVETKINCVSHWFHIRNGHQFNCNYFDTNEDLDYCASVRGSNEDAALRLVIIVDLDHLINDEQ